MPLARHVGSVASRLEVLTPPATLLPFPFAVVVNRVGVPNESTRVQHGATGNTDRSTPGAHVEGVRESRAASSQRIQVRSFDLFGPQSIDRAETLVVGEDEDDVRGRRLLGSKSNTEANDEANC